MKFAIELADGGPYERVTEGDLKAEEFVPAVGDSLVWNGVEYTVKQRFMDYDDEIVIIRAARP